MGNAADLRALIHVAMLEHAAIAPRGFDSIKRRQDLHRQVDDMLDDYALEVAVEQPTVSQSS